MADEVARRYHRRIIRIRAQDSPNVRLYEEQLRAGIKPDYRDIVPGVVSARSYKLRRRTWDPIKQCIGLDANFYEGAEVLLYPPQWLDRAESIALDLRSKLRQGMIRRDKNLKRCIGIDPAEGGDRTSMTCSDTLGILEQVSKRTPDTTAVVSDAIAFMKKWDVDPSMVLIDRGGGKAHADRLRAMGYKVRTIGFGEAVMLDPKRGRRRIEEKLENKEDRYAYVNRRAQMYGDLRMLLDPCRDDEGLPGFGIPPHLTELRRQLAPIPLIRTEEGKLKLPPKKKKPGSKERSLIDIIGCSPDEADSLVLSVHGLLHAVMRVRAGGSMIQK